MNERIRLTNKTAIALRKNANKVRTAYRIAACVLSVVLAVAAFLIGLRYLIAVPLMAVLIVLMDCALVLHSRTRYLSLIGQAICTEAAAQEIRAGSSEKTRRERAISDLMGVQADVQRAERGMEDMHAPGAHPFFEAEKADDEEEDDDLLPVRRKQGNTLEMPQEHAAPRRRRRPESGLQLIKNEAK